MDKQLDMFGPVPEQLEIAEQKATERHMTKGV